MSRKLTAAEFFEKNNAAPAEKDLENLAKVFKLVFEMLSENTPDSSERLSELISAYSSLNNSGDGGESGEQE